MSETKVVVLHPEQLATISAALDAQPETDATKDARRAIYYARDPEELANGILQREYENAVSAIADEAKAKIADLADTEITDSDELYEWLHESVDGNEWIIYTHRNFQVLRYSSNDSAAIDEFGPDGVVRDGNTHWAGLAYSAMLADVNEELGDVQELFDAREEAQDAADADDDTDAEAEESPTTTA